VIALLANPDSGSGEAGEVERLLQARGHAFRSFAADRAAEAAAVHPDRLVVAGGDGSIGRAAEAAARAGLPLGVVPVGTANDFARALGLPTELEAAVELAAEGRATRPLDLGRVGDRPFVNAASAGLAPVAARKARGLKGAIGPLAYAVGALRAGLFAKPVEARVRVDTETLLEGRAWQVIVAVTGAFGGGSDVEADPADGRLDVVAIEAGSRARLIAHGYGLRAGRVERQEGVIADTGLRVEVEARGGAGFNVDGEVLDATAAEFTIEPRAFEAVVGS
jgi:YegS/Rv2252/BmrU family lipid kinase